MELQSQKFVKLLIVVLRLYYIEDAKIRREEEKDTLYIYVSIDGNL